MDVEKLIAETILQDSKEEIIAGKKMKVARPSTATMIEFSKYSHTFPVLPILRPNEELNYVIAHGDEFQHIGELIAILLLGKKHLYTEKKIFGITWKKTNNIKKLAPLLLQEYTNEELDNMLADLLSIQRIGFFLHIIITLNDSNILKKTRTGTTTSGL